MPPKHYSQWNHTADALQMKGKRGGREYTVEINTDGSESPGGVGSGIAFLRTTSCHFIRCIDRLTSAPTTRRSNWQ
jgi:hypothetical protein